MKGSISNEDVPQHQQIAQTFLSVDIYKLLSLFPLVTHLFYMDIMYIVFHILTIQVVGYTT